MSAVGRLFGDNQAVVYMDESKGSKQGKTGQLIVYAARVYLRSNKNRVREMMEFLKYHRAHRWKKYMSKSWRIPANDLILREMFSLYRKSSSLYFFRTISDRLSDENTLKLWAKSVPGVTPVIPSRPEAVGFGIAFLGVYHDVVRKLKIKRIRFVSDTVSWMDLELREIGRKVEFYTPVKYGIDLVMESMYMDDIHKYFLGAIDTDAYIWHRIHNTEIKDDIGKTYHERSILHDQAIAEGREPIPMPTAKALNDSLLVLPFYVKLYLADLVRGMSAKRVKVMSSQLIKEARGFSG